MSKRNKIIIGVLILFLLGIVGVFKVNFSSGYKISNTNNTNNTNKIVGGLEIRYKTGGVIIQSISQIQPKNSWKYTIDTNNIQSENSIILKYKDNKCNSYEEYIVGYLEKGYRGNVNVAINNIDKNGKLDMKIK